MNSNVFYYLLFTWDFKKCFLTNIPPRRLIDKALVKRLGMVAKGSSPLEQVRVFAMSRGSIVHAPATHEQHNSRVPYSQTVLPAIATYLTGMFQESSLKCLQKLRTVPAGLEPTTSRLGSGCLYQLGHGTSLCCECFDPARTLSGL